MFKQLFAAIVRPNLKYEAPIWNHHSKEQIILIRNVQGMAANQVQGISDMYTIHPPPPPHTHTQIITLTVNIFKNKLGKL